MKHSVHLAFYVFGVIFVAELPDKTALATLVLATQRRPLPVFWGAAIALTVQSAVAVAAGSVLTLCPPAAVRVGSGLVFLASALVMAVRGLRTSKVDGSAHTSAASPSDAGAPSFPASPSLEAPSRSRRPDSFVRTFATVFGVIFVAEWGDLTQFATAALAARERSPLLVFAASTAALWSVAALAVGLGHRAARILRPEILERGAAVVFALIGGALLGGWI